MYKDFYGLSDKPFNIVPNPAYFYKSKKHQEALTHLEYGLMEGAGFILLTGEIGSGKTTLIRYLLNNIELNMNAVVIFNTNINADQLISQILDELGIISKKDKSDNLGLLYHYLINEFSKGNRVLLIIDEAQNLAYEVLEEIRMLSNLQSDEDILLVIMLVGQPDLIKKIKSPKLAQLAQRVSVNYHLNPLPAQEVREYISFRLKKAGGKQDIFTAKAISIISTASQGIPRIINQLCDTAMVYGYGDDLKIIEAEVIEHVIRDKKEILFNTEKTVKSEVIKENPWPVKEIREGENFTQLLEKIEETLHQIRLESNLTTSDNEDFKKQVINMLQSFIHSKNKFEDTFLKLHAYIDKKLDKPAKKQDRISSKKKKGIKQWFAR